MPRISIINHNMQLKHKLYLLKERIKNLYLIPICRRSPFLSSVYYVFFSREFDREHQKVLEGKYMHLKALKSGAPNTFHLRRQVHRLEKGLIMKEKRDVFALDYIMDTVQNRSEERRVGKEGRSRGAP